MKKELPWDNYNFPRDHATKTGLCRGLRDLNHYTEWMSQFFLLLEIMTQFSCALAYYDFLPVCFGTY